MIVQHSPDFFTTVEIPRNRKVKSQWLKANTSYTQKTARRVVSVGRPTRNQADSQLLPGP